MIRGVGSFGDRAITIPWLSIGLGAILTPAKRKDPSGLLITRVFDPRDFPRI